VALNPDIEPLDADAVQVKVVPRTSVVGVITALVPLQIEELVGLLVIVGLGLTVTTKFTGVPGQLDGAGPIGVTT
jgi:hypothetical protein